MHLFGRDYGEYLKAMRGWKEESISMVSRDSTRHSTWKGKGREGE
jgi:hypothetical protein